MSIQALSKDFNGVPVLKSVSYQLAAGQITGVIGENGAGKSTFMKILAGIYTPSAGTLAIEGRTLSALNPIRARQEGIAMVPQEFHLVDSLPVYQNVFLGNELHRFGFLDKKTMIAKTISIFNDLALALDPTSLTARLSIAQKQFIVIAKALLHNPKILILDEPTTVLNAHESQTLFTLLRKLATQGMAMFFISHKLQEIKQLCDDVLILRDGEQVYSGATNLISEEGIASKMVGRELNKIFPPKSNVQGEILFEVKNLKAPPIVENVNFTIAQGEILGMAGMIGAGRTETAEALIGLRNTTEASVFYKGKSITLKTIHDALRYKIAYLSEDRQGTGLVLSFPLAKNISLMSLKKYLRFGFIQKRIEEKMASDYTTNFNIRAADLNASILFFSGGNQQKVYLAKLLDTNPELLILDEPTRGVDIGAKIEIYQAIRALADRGIACLIISSELEELLGLCNRILVMRAGKISAVVEGNSMTEEEIMYYATGVK